ncbi:MAG: hypothetical protein E7055_18065 [Lentisphaerae bacterium]|nr:hypothetical protein [Lentisphaerota bacterium]
MLPSKLTHGDNLANLFDKYNRLVDYLRETRLVAGPGIRINRLPAGTTIESTAAASGGTPSAPTEGHPFDATIINKGTEENPDYYAKIYNSSLPDSPYAGIVYVGDWELEVPVTELAVNTENGFWVYLTVSYIEESTPPFSTAFHIMTYGSDYPYGDDKTYVTFVAEGKLPNIASRTDSDISVYGRYI